MSVPSAQCVWRKIEISDSRRAAGSQRLLAVVNKRGDKSNGVMSIQSRRETKK
jgi:hypothetical protein